MKLEFHGGEPLLREDIIDIAKELYKEKCKVYLTTNGFFLNEQMEICKYLKKINISIHSLDNKKYKRITGTDINVEEIIQKIRNVKNNYPNLDITIDVTILKGLNTTEDIDKFIELSKKMNIKIKFIELFGYSKEYWYKAEEIRERLLDLGFKKTNEYIRKTKYVKDEAQIYIAKCFCDLEENRKKCGKYCNRYNDLYISPDGKIQLCRLNNKEIDILKDLKSRNEKELLKKINNAYEILGENCPINGGKLWR